MKNFIPTLAIVEKYFRSSNSALICCMMAMDLEPYYTKLSLLERDCPYVVKETILHDINGIKSKDENFLPRLS